MTHQTKLRCAVITPVGPGHQDSYSVCASSIQAAMAKSMGPFDEVKLHPVWDLEGKLGRSHARNLGIQQMIDEGIDWIFFLDADDLMDPDCFANVADHIGNHDAIWGLIVEAPANAPHAHQLRKGQLEQTQSYLDILDTPPFLTLQMGHFVRADLAKKIGFDEKLDTGEDFKYYMQLWSTYRCAKIAKRFFINCRGNHSTGPRSANGAQWTQAVSQVIRQAKINLLGTLTSQWSNLAGRAAVVVAHPCDEILWAGGFLCERPGLDVIVCSVPITDPKRLLTFFETMRSLRHNPIVIPDFDAGPEIPLRLLDLIPLSKYDTIFTHGLAGESEPLHHKQIYHHIKTNFAGTMFAFAPQKGEIRMGLETSVQKKKLDLLRAYDATGACHGGSFVELLSKAPLEPDCETYKLVKMPAIGHLGR